MQKKKEKENSVSEFVKIKKSLCCPIVLSIIERQARNLYLK